MKKIAVMLVDDHAMVRNGVRLMLSSASDIEIAGEASNALEAMNLLRGLHVNVALLDITLPGKNGLDLLKQLRAEFPKMAVLMLSTYAEDIYAVRALKLGAAGYLTKDCLPPVLIDAIHKAAAGSKHISAAVVDKLANIIGGSGRNSSQDALSNRELEVLKLLAKGESLVKIGDTLHLSPNTITTYRARILEKLDLRSNAELARYALENGLLV